VNCSQQFIMLSSSIYNRLNVIQGPDILMAKIFILRLDVKLEIPLQRYLLNKHPDAACAAECEV
jgi:hypothetical protein